MKKTKLISLGLLLLAIVLTLFAVKQFNNTKDFIKYGNKTEATVVEMIESSDDNSIMYTPVFRYTDELGNEITYRSSVSSNPPEYNVGDKENVIFMPNTDDVRVNTIWGLYGFSIMLSISAIISLILGIKIYVNPKDII